MCKVNMHLRYCRKLMCCRQFREYLEANGYDTTAMGLPGSQSETETVESLDEKSEKKVDV